MELKIFFFTCLIEVINCIQFDKKLGFKMAQKKNKRNYRNISPIKFYFSKSLPLRNNDNIVD